MPGETAPITIVPPVPFRYTFEEFEETHLILNRRRLRLASAPHGDDALRPAPNWRRISRYVITVGLLAGLIAMNQYGDELPGFLRRRPDEDVLMKIFGPILLFAASLSILVHIGRGTKLKGLLFTRTPAQKRATRMALLYPALGFVYMAVAVVNSLHKGTTDTLLHDLTMVLAPWIFISVSWFLLGSESRAIASHVMRKAWDEAPHLHTEKRIDINVRGFRLTDSQARYEMDWERFKGEEGDNLIILIAGAIFFMVPKRVLSMEQIEFIRDRLGLRPAEARTGGFPVVQVQPE